MTKFGPSATFKLLTALTIFSTLAISSTVAQQVKAGTNDGQKVATANLTPAAPHSSSAAVRTVNANSTVWPAPIGHRQPRVADVPVSTSKDSFNFAQEDVNVDRKISGICRGC